MTNAKTTTKKFNAKTATQAEFDKELKRIASIKCNAGKAIKAAQANGEEVTEEMQAKYDDAVAQYDKVRAAKNRRFKARKTYMDFTAAEIKELNLEQTMAGIASLACRRSRYPHLSEETLKQETRFQAHKTELQGKAEAREALRRMSPAEIEALMAELK